MFIIVTGTFYLGPMVTKLLAISDANRMGALQDPYYLQGEKISLYFAVANSIMLILAVIFSVYKPWKNIRKGK